MRAPSLAPQAWRTTRSISRPFSTAVPLRLNGLAYDLHAPPSGNKAGVPILFLHGLFGSKKNNRSISKVLARQLDRPVYALDLRNHGDSPHHPTHTYDALSSDVLAFIRQHSLRSPCIVGHSMGAKTAMALALSHPEVPGSIVAVDNAPVDAALKSDFGGYVQAMYKVADAKVASQKHADAILQDFAEELPVRQFLLTNLTKPKELDYYVWRIPVKILGRALDNMADFPFKDPDEARFEKPALFVRGTLSHYVPDEVLPTIGRFFPRFQVADVAAGHWVISENPEGFRKAVVDFLEVRE